MDEPNKANVVVCRDLCERVMQREVNRCEDHFESRREERHCVLANLRTVGKQIRLPMKVTAYGFHVYWVCDAPTDVAVEFCATRLVNIGNRAAGCIVTLFSTFDRGGVRGQVTEEQDRIIGEFGGIFNPLKIDVGREARDITFEYRSIGKEHPTGKIQDG